MRLRSQESALGPALLDVWQGPVPNVSTSHFQRLVIRKAPNKKVDLCSRASPSTLRIRLGRGLPGSDGSLLCGLSDHIQPVVPAASRYSLGLRRLHHLPVVVFLVIPPHPTPQ